MVFSGAGELVRKRDVPHRPLVRWQPDDDAETIHQP